MRSFLLLAILVLAALPQVSFAQACDPSLRFVGYRRTVPAETLPSSVPRGDSISLFADFDKADSGFVPVYLVNGTDSTALVPSQDGYIYLKLEAQDSGSRWLRAQRHGYGWCGNSYYPVRLPPKHAFELRGYQPLVGVRSNIRYGLYGDLRISSNSGVGMADSSEIAACRSDVMFFRTAPISVLGKIALAQGSPLGADPWEARRQAINHLVYHPSAIALRILALNGSDSDARVRQAAHGAMDLLFRRNDFAVRHGTID